MAILLDNTNRLFTLTTENSMYQMKADKYDVLLHTYYGKKTAFFDYSRQIAYLDHGCSGNPYEVGHDRPYSLDVLPLEYSTFGTGDYRSSALKVRYANGGFSCDLRYLGFEVREGKYDLPGLPAFYATENVKSDTLIITLEDTCKKFYVHLYYGVMEEYDLITRAVVIENHSDEIIHLENVQSMCLDFKCGKFDLHTFYGRYAKEREYERRPMNHGIQTIGSTRGTSSHHQNPFFMLTDSNATEETGNCYGFSFVYSGDFIGTAELDCYSQTRVLLGIHPDNFDWRLDPGASFHAPEVAMTYSANGMEKLSHNYHKAIRDNLCRGKHKYTRRPVLLNSWEGVYFTFTGEKLIEMAKEASELGVELFVMDDGWFGKRDNDQSGLGDWKVNEEKLGCTMAEIADKIHSFGMQFGVWFEPEGVSEDSDLYRAHPDWALKLPGKTPNRSRFELLLDFSREDVREYIWNQITDILDHASIDYFKWDFNRSMCDVYSALLPADRQGEVAHRYVLGLYEMMEKLNQRYPDMLIEGCAAGGARFDAGLLYYTPQIWVSDNTDAIDRLSLQYGTSFCYPVRTMGAHVSKCPNEQTGRVTPIETRGTVAMSGTFGYELDVNHMPEEEKEAVKHQIAEFKELYDLVQYGTYYRLTNPKTCDCYHGWQFVSEDQSESLVCLVAVTIEPNDGGRWMKLRGLDENAVYEINGEQFPGDVLMTSGILLPKAHVEYQSFKILMKKCM